VFACKGATRPRKEKAKLVPKRFCTPPQTSHSIIDIYILRRFRLFRPCLAAFFRSRNFILRTSRRHGAPRAPSSSSCGYFRFLIPYLVYQLTRRRSRRSVVTLGVLSKNNGNRRLQSPAASDSTTCPPDASLRTCSWPQHSSLDDTYRPYGQSQRQTRFETRHEACGGQERPREKQAGGQVVVEA